MHGVTMKFTVDIFVTQLPEVYQTSECILQLKNNSVIDIIFNFLHQTPSTSPYAWTYVV